MSDRFTLARQRKLQELIGDLDDAVKTAEDTDALLAAMIKNFEAAAEIADTEDREDASMWAALRDLAKRLRERGWWARDAVDEAATYLDDLRLRNGGSV
jgi:phosphate uptake regulator